MHLNTDDFIVCFFWELNLKLSLSKDMITSFFKSDNKDFENFTSKMYILYILLDSSSVNVDREK